MVISNPPSLRIIVADDDADVRAYYERTLPSLGHQVVSSASTGWELVNCTREQTPDLIITDVQMPGMNGWDAIDCVSDHVPCIIVSAEDRPGEWARRHSASLVAYLIKPISRRDLELALVDALAWRRE